MMVQEVGDSVLISYNARAKWWCGIGTAMLHVPACFDLHELWFRGVWRELMKATQTSALIFSTPDLADKYPDKVRVLESLFRNFGGKKNFCGQAVTVKCFEDNSRVKELAAQDGAGKVMVVDGGGSLRKALLGDVIATCALENGWEGLVIYGSIRDVDVMEGLQLGVKALDVIPLKTERKGLGEVNVAVQFAGQEILPGEWIYADNNGILLSSAKLV
jgi:regulator of ribonuclease activity A